MKVRVRRRFLELGRREEARAAEGAWISTIHGLCARMLRTHALSAGIDPGFRVLDELEAERLALDAFDGALEEFMADGADPDRIEMVAAYTPDRLRDMVRTVHSHLRSRGQRQPSLEEARSQRARGRARAARGRCPRSAGRARPGGPGSATVERAIERLQRCLELLDATPAGAAPEATPSSTTRSSRGSATALSTDACEEYREALAALRSLRPGPAGAARPRAAARAARALRRTLRAGEAASAPALDFEDLELIARDLLAGDAGLREAYAGRFAHVLVDEFQDTNPLQNELLELLSRDNLFRVGDENQSIYRFRNADVRVFREPSRGGPRGGRRATASRSTSAPRGEVLDAIDLAFERIWGERLRAAARAPGRSRAGTPRVEPCVELLVVDRPKSHWDERFAGRRRRTRSAQLCAAPRSGARPRRG